MNTTEQTRKPNPADINKAKKLQIINEFKAFLIQSGQSENDQAINLKDLSKMSLKRLTTFKELFNV